MEKFFKPVHSPSGLDETKSRKHHHHLPHHHHQDPQSNRYTMLDDTDRNTDESHGHHRHHQRDRYLHNNPHHDARHFQTQQFNHSEEDEILYNHNTSVTLSRASSSSLSSSSSSTSFSSWYTEESANDRFSLRHAEQPQHSLSCSNISDVRRGFREDDGSEPVVFATIKHPKKGSVCSESHGSAQKREEQSFASLDRGHSRSEQGLLQGNEGDLGGKQTKVPHVSRGPLYKSASLNRSLAFSEQDLVLGDSRGPKRAVSSIQLPCKGILKNKEPRNDIRKAKSMEVLSPRVSKEQDPSGQKGKGPTQVEIEQARANFVEGKLQFSAFLDEITKQVISPSALNVLGVNSDKSTGKTPALAPTPDPIKPQLPPKKRRESSGEEREQHRIQHSRPEKPAPSSSRKHLDCSNPDKLISYAARNHHGSPPPHYQHQSPSLNAHHDSSNKDRRPSPTGSSLSGDRYGRCGPHLTDGTSTSPEPSQPNQRHHRKKQPTASISQHTQNFPLHQPQAVHPGPHGHRGPIGSPPSSAQGAGPGLGSESSSTKSDSSRARDTGSTATSPNSEQSGRHQSQYVKQRRDPLGDADHLLALEEENSDLHQNLLQTVVCIESLEVELQRTRDELNHVKEKYKSLLETHSGTKQANNLLGEHLHIASESLSSERKYLQNRVSQLSSELEDAHRTIAAMENINVPCLIKELLEKHFDSAEAIQKFLKTPTPISHPAASPQAADGQPKVKEAAHDWLTKSNTGPQRVTAFIPFKQEVPTIATEGTLSSQHESSHSQPFSVADISTAIYKKMAASYAAKPVYPQSQQQLPQSSNHTGPPANLQQAHVGGDSWGGRGEVKVTLLEQDVVHVTSMSAQQILDDFLQQLQPHGEVTEQQGGQEWAGGAEQTGRVAE